MSADTHMLAAISDFRQAVRQRMVYVTRPTTGVRREMREAADHVADALVKDVPQLAAMLGRSAVVRALQEAADQELGLAA